MVENLLTLLENSELFSLDNSFAPQIKVEILEPDGFRFFLANCFDGCDLDFFCMHLKMFLRQYIETWAKLIDNDPKKDFDWQEYSHKVFGFFEGFRWEEIFNSILYGKKYYDIPIEVNGSRVRIKRFGNILALNILNINPNSGRKEHVTGQRAVTALRQEPGKGPYGVYRLIDKIRVSISLPFTKENGSMRVCDFFSLSSLLLQALPWVEWNFSGAKLVETYCSSWPRPILKIGEYRGLDIHGNLKHAAKSINVKNGKEFGGEIWRKGNVRNLKGEIYEFTFGEDLSLQLDLVSSLPRSIFASPDVESDFCKEQFKIIRAGATFCAQLCSLQLNRYFEKFF